jgi:hypothetical protein
MAARSHELMLASTTPSPTAHASASTTSTTHPSATASHAPSPTAAAVPKSGGPPSDGFALGWLPYLLAGLTALTVASAAAALATRKVRR